MRFSNRLVITILKSPIRRVLSGSTDVIRYSGRRSGREFVTPTQFARFDDGIVIFPARPNTKTWWKNFRGGHDLDVLLDGEWTAMRGTVRRGRDDPERVRALLDVYLERFPRVAKQLQTDPDAGIDDLVLVECHPRTARD